jgi:hypothetical protein
MLYWRYGHHRAIRRGRWKLTMPAGEPAGLYDLSTDVAESKDRSAEHPEVVTELTRLYARWDSELQPPRWRDLFLKDAPAPGRVASTQPRNESVIGDPAAGEVGFTGCFAAGEESQRCHASS